MQKEVVVALIELFGDLAWPIAALIAAIYFINTLKSGILTKILPDGGTISFGDARVEVRKNLEEAEHATESLRDIPEEVPLSRDEENFDDVTEPYDLVMDTWYELADAITGFAVAHGGEDDRRKVWTNLEHLVYCGQLSEEKKGAVRDLQKARNSIRRLQEVDRTSAKRFAETARKLTNNFLAMQQV